MSAIPWLRATKCGNGVLRLGAGCGRGKEGTYGEEEEGDGGARIGLLANGPDVLGRPTREDLYDRRVRRVVSQFRE